MKRLIYLASVAITLGSFLGYFSTVREARAYGNLMVDTTVPSGDPIFTIANWLPGDCETRTITITQEGDTQTAVATKGLEITSINNLPEVTDFSIVSGSEIYFSGTLREFFVASGAPDGISLGSLNPLETRVYEFKACFRENAGNEYQNASVVFDLVFGETFDNDIELPAECSHLAGIITARIDGTAGNDRIRGTHESELIIGHGGNDRLDGGGGHDCIVGGDGNDNLEGGHGQDVIIGRGGNDRIEGGSLNDIIYGGDGNDNLWGGSGDDIIYAGAGNDRVVGDSGNDQIFLGAGNDQADGGSGNDTIYGDEGNDNLKGGAGKDVLWGGAGFDRINGNSNVDSCYEGEQYTSCEN